MTGDRGRSVRDGEEDVGSGSVTRTRAHREFRQLDLDDNTVELTAIHVGDGLLRGRGVRIFERGLALVLAGCDALRV